MSDRIKGYTITLDGDYCDEDAEQIRNALLMVKGVLSVGQSISTPEDWMNRERVRNELADKMLNALKAKPPVK